MDLPTRAAAEAHGSRRARAAQTTLRQLALLAAVTWAITSPVVRASAEIGLSPAEFSASGNSTLRAAGYAFSIWGLIYAGLVAFGIYQALPAQRDSRLLQRLSVPALVAILGSGLWIWASAFDARWPSVAIIALSASFLTAGLLRATAEPVATTARWLAWWPLCLLAGWLTVATALNVLTVLTAERLIDGHHRAAGLTGIGAAFAIAIGVLRNPRMAPYGLPIAWGLIAVWVAEYERQGDVAAMAMGCAILIGGYAIWQGRPAVGAR